MNFRSKIDNISSKNLKYIQIAFYSIWFTLNIVQATFTDLIFDEAYYWVCSNNIDWGHFYYPPFIDILIQAGGLFFKGAIGVRLLFAILSTVGVYLLERVLIGNNKPLFYAIMLSIIPLQVAGILAAPDIPLFVSTITFYHLFKQFLEYDRDVVDSLDSKKVLSITAVTILLSINTATLLYIKYHGVLIIAFSFLFNIKTLYNQRRSYIWIALSILLFSPHLLWQFQNDFPTVNFHLFNRPAQQLLHPKNILDYIPGQILFAGPLVGLILLYSLFKLKVESRYERTLLYNLLAMYLFFGLFSIKDHIEINWTVIGLPPLILLAHKSICSSRKMTKLVYQQLPISIVIMILLRGSLIFAEHIPLKRFQMELSNHKEWSETIETLAKGRPVVFSDKYQHVAIYNFYKPDTITYTLNPYQPSDYDIFGLEEQLQGQDVLLATRYRFSETLDSINSCKGAIYYTYLDNFRSYKRVEINIDSINTSECVELSISMTHDYPYSITFRENPSTPTYIGYNIYHSGESVATFKKILKAEELLNRSLKIRVPLEDISLLSGDKYQIQFYLKTGIFHTQNCSRYIEFIAP